MKTILVVDDSPIDRRLAGGILEAENVKPIYAEHGREALKIWEKEQPAAILTDLQMPEMDGLELVREIKQRSPSTPVILMTGQGSEEIAAEALRVGALSYVPKRNLKRDLPGALAIVLSAVAAARRREQVQSFLQHSESYYVFGYEPDATRSLVSHLLEGLAQMSVFDEAEWLRVGTALGEALTNAIDHGNLELDSKLREQDGNQYRTLGKQRAQEAPYRDRRVHVTARLSPDEASFSIRDEGPGFDPSSLPDPTNPENLVKPSGRGVLLIRTFMDDVRFNKAGNEITMIKRRST